MPREIKFRAWDKVAKKIIQVDNLVWDITGYLVSFNSGNFSSIMQFTGLHDKNGKEIYEGDMLDDWLENCFVIWCKNCGGFSVAYNLDKKINCMACDGDISWREIVESKELKVIGNIYQNPELLK